MAHHLPTSGYSQTINDVLGMARALDFFANNLDLALDVGDIPRAQREAEQYLQQTFIWLRGMSEMDRVCREYGVIDPEKMWP